MATPIWPPSCHWQLESAADTSRVLCANKYFECLSHAGHRSRLWRFGSEQNCQGPCSRGAYSLVGVTQADRGVQGGSHLIWMVAIVLRQFLLWCKTISLLLCYLWFLEVQRQDKYRAVLCRIWRNGLSLQRFEPAYIGPGSSRWDQIAGWCLMYFLPKQEINIRTAAYVIHSKQIGEHNNKMLLKRT